ncbi:MAG: hypothetical protein JRI23_01590 [Deltaproteobacteria bacterium]|nr:hypothetical protein [Deltaproteobacteria bacterium]MBW2530159.1 hypothetical protein [Deltaproteobacteria bacterium]
MNTNTMVLGGVAVVVIAAVSLMLLRDRSVDEAERPPPPRSTVAGRASWAALDVAAFADAQVEIEHLRKQNEVDWSAVRAAYRRTLPVVRATDLRQGSSYESEMAAALERCEKGERPRVHQQVIAKGLQHVAVLGIDEELRSMSAGADAAKTAMARITSFAKGIRATFVRRDRDYFGEQPTLAKALDDALGDLRAAARAEEQRRQAAQALGDAIARTYALSVLYEIEEIEKLRGSDREACEVKRMEAIIFFRIIAGRVAEQDAQARGEIETMLKASPDQMNATALESLLQRGLPGLALR